MRENRGVFWGLVASSAVVVTMGIAVLVGYLVGHFTHSKTKTVTAAVAAAPHVNGSEAGATTTASATTSTSSGEATAALPGASWSGVGGDLGLSRDSTLTQITPENASDLGLAVSAPIDNIHLPSSGGENNPIAVNGIVYLESGLGTAGAYDGATGRPVWQRSARELGNVAPAGTRGEAYGDGMLFVDQIGGTLEALDATTGAVRWKTLVNTEHVTGYSAQSAVYADGLVFVGQSGSDVIGGIRGYIKAFDARTGRLAWTFYSIPDPGTPDARSWGATRELRDGGGATWTNVAVDPQLHTVYIPTGNTWPDFGRTAGDELYTDGVAAVDEQTGRLKWFYQTTHHDEWDYDCSQPPVLWNQEINGQEVRGLSLGCKNGYVYELDRQTGRPVTPVREEPLANASSDPQAKAHDERVLDWLRTGGRPLTEPIPVDAGAVTPHCASPALLPKRAPDGKPYEYSCAYNYYATDHFVAGTGEQGLNWQPASYNQRLGYTYYCANNGIRAVKIQNVRARQTQDVAVWPQLYQNGVGGAEPRTGYFTALDLRTNKTVWQRRFPTTTCTGGSATTETGIVFGTDSSSTLFAWDARTGRQLWSYTLPGLSIVAPPIIYEAHGNEYVAVMATINQRGVLLGFALRSAVPEIRSQFRTTTPGGNIVSVAVGRTVFNGRCGACHTLADAGTLGTAGPNLDTLRPSRDAVVAQVTTGSRGMPAFGGVLSAAQIRSVGEYVSRVAGNGAAGGHTP